jgi:monoamine oxidase
MNPVLARPPQPHFRRRDVLLGAAAAVCSPAIARAAALIPAGAERIVVLGAGIAGLAAAHRLRETGRRVTVLEGRTEAGGRMRTARMPFDDGLYGELGAARVFDTHFYLQHWLNALNMNLVPFSPPAGASLLAIGNRRERMDDPQAGARLFPALRAEEKGLTPPQLAGRYLMGLPDDLANPETSAAIWARWAAFDRVTWPQWLASRGASEAAVRLMTLGADSSQISALYVLRQIMLHREGKQYLKIEGGMDRLPRALAQQLRAEIRYGCEVTRLETVGQEVRVTFRDRGRNETLAADRAVISLPFSILRNIAIAPALSPSKRDAVANLPYRTVTRFLLQTRTPFWRAAGWNGAARTDAPAELWDAGAGQLSARGLVSITAGGRPDMHARFAAMSEAERVQNGIAIASGAFPGVSAQFQKGITQNWAADPWARGGFAVFLPGQMTRWGDNLGRAEGRLYFAGEHTSPWQGWIEGALYSADRVFQEILG